MSKLEVDICGVTFKNPIMPASGTFGSGLKMKEVIDINELGAIVTKGVSLEPWKGNPTPRVAETTSLATSGSVPKAAPPLSTFGQDILSSNISISVSFNLFITSIYSSKE